MDCDRLEGAMAKFIYFTKEQKERAKNTDLAEFLRSKGEILKRSGREWEWSYNGAKITVNGNKWYHQYEQRGGFAIDFVKEFWQVPYVDAVSMLLGINSIALPTAVQKPLKPFALPQANSDMRRAFAYLMQRRYITREVISFFAHQKMLYEDTRHNIVFVGHDEKGTPQHAHKKSTSVNDSYRGNVIGSRAEYSFHYIGTSETIYVFEAPIDMLSFVTLHQDGWEQHSYVALCSVAEKALIFQLEQNQRLQKIFLCLDHDKPGIEASYRIVDQLRQGGYSDISVLQSVCKDWNEDLKLQNHQEVIYAEDCPNMETMKELCSEVVMNSRYSKITFNTIGKMTDDFEKAERRIKNKEFVSEKSYDMAIKAFLLAKDSYRQLQIPITDEQLGDKLFSFYLPHKDNTPLKTKLRDLSDSLYAIKRKSESNDIIGKSQAIKQIDDILRLCANCLSVYLSVNIGQAQSTEITMQRM